MYRNGGTYAYPMPLQVGSSRGRPRREYQAASNELSRQMLWHHENGRTLRELAEYHGLCCSAVYERLKRARAERVRNRA